MKKIKESDKKILIVDVILYIIYIVIGYLLLKYPEIEVLEPIKYAPYLFFAFGFFSLVAYFINRRKNDYEFLLLGLINIVCASMVLFYSYYGNTGFILGNAILIYSIAMVLNKGWHTIKLSRDNDIYMFPKFAITILLTLLGLLVITNLYRETTMQTLILGYYFLCFGVLSLLEPIMILIIKYTKLNGYLTSLVEENVKKEYLIIKEVKSEPLKVKDKKVSIPAPEKVKEVKNIEVKTVKKVNTTKKKNVIKQPANNKNKNKAK